MSDPGSTSTGLGDRGSASSSRALLCAALLASGRPISEPDLCRVLDVGPEGVRAALADLRSALAEARLGLVIEEVAGGHRLVVAPGLVPALSDLLAPQPLPRLSEAALETLALVAYQQPVTRGRLETARGASCASTLDTLLERDLIRVVGRKDVVGRPLLYGTTDRFLLEFGLASLDDLPPLDEQPGEFLRG